MRSNCWRAALCPRPRAMATSWWWKCRASACMKWWRWIWLRGTLDSESHMQPQQGWARLAALLVVAALLPWPLLLGPNNWWAFILVTAAIVGALRLLLGQHWKICAGLALPRTHV